MEDQGLWIGPFDAPDRYRLGQVVSRGGEGELWRAALRIDGAEFPVAVKLIHARHDAELDEWQQRWQRQAELLRSLDHPAVVKVREVFVGPIPHPPGASDPGSRTLVLVMNWAEGSSLDEWVARNPNRDSFETARLLRLLAEAVDYLHTAFPGRPVVHRDIKPSNVIVDGKTVRLVDFGFVRILGQEPLTLAGTPTYMAPELLRGGGFSEASDRFALGGTVYYVLTGQHPTPDNLPAMRNVLMATAGFEGRADMADHVLSMMDPEPARRPSDCVGWASGLISTITTGGTTRLQPASPAPPVAEAAPPKRSGRGKVLAAVAVVVLLLLGAVGIVLAQGGGGGGGDGDSDVLATDRASSTDDADRTTTTEAELEMPDVVGDDLAAARATLRALDLVDITVEYRPSAKEPGTVLEQDPAAGETSPDEITLVVAEAPDSVPELVGKSIEEATRIAQEIGARLTITDVVDESKPDGTVLEQSPEAGSPVVEEIAVKVARRGVGVYVSDLQRVEGNADTGLADLNGQPYAHSVVLNGCCYRGVQRTVGYDLSRDFTRLKGKVGLRDDTRSGAQVKVEAFADGRAIFSQTMELGRAADVDLDVTGVLRLQLSVTQIGDNGGAVVWGDLQLLGTPAAVEGRTSTTG